MAGARAGPCSTFIMTSWACEPGEQAGLKDCRSLAGREERREGEERPHRDGGGYGIGPSYSHGFCSGLYSAVLKQGQEMTW